MTIVARKMVTVIIHRRPSIDFNAMDLPRGRTRLVGGQPSWAPEEYAVDCLNSAEADALIGRLNEIDGVTAKIQ